MNKRTLPPKLSSDAIITYKDAIRKMEHISDYDQEVIILITVNSDNRIIGEHLISIGTMDEALLDYRILLNRIISDKASGFIIGHNHVNGVSFFSYDDFMSAARLKYISIIMGLDFMDELLFANGRSPACMSQRHPKFWNRNFYVNFEENIKKYIPKIKG